MVNLKQYQISYYLMTCIKRWNVVKIFIISIAISTKPQKPHSRNMVCTKYNAENKWSRFLKIKFTFIIGLKHSVACKWNHKIYLFSHSHTPIFLRDQLQFTPTELPTHLLTQVSQKPLSPIIIPLGGCGFQQIQIWN